MSQVGRLEEMLHTKQATNKIHLIYKAQLDPAKIE